MIRTAQVEQGQLRGIPAADPRITAFKGIPFAAPPVGNLRFAPPQPPAPWEGTRFCGEFSPIPVQPSPERNPSPDDIYAREWSVDPDIPVSEDCLYLNVWTPARSAGEKLPVYFWIYGGGWQVGHTAEMEFDGERIARRGIVVVTVNYRVNLFGFMCHPEITQEYPDAPTNFGLLDQQFALKWVYRNIAAFGGNPENITIGGQSAGGGSVLFHVSSAESRKYFRRAVVESGIFENPFSNVSPRRSVKEAEQLGVEFFSFCGAKNLQEARKIPTDVLREKWSAWGGYGKSIQTWLPVYDGLMVKSDFTEGIRNGSVKPCPLLLGFTGDEFLVSSGQDGSSPLINMVELGIRNMQRAAEGAGLQTENYFYRFDVPIPGWDNPGTFHSVDLWFFFETLAKCWRPFTGMHYDIARRMCNYLCNFIKDGNPNGDDASGEKLPAWKPFSTKEPNCMVFGTECVPQQLAPSAEIAKYLK